MRTAHFPKLRARTLFAHGSKDPFGTIEEMEAALREISAPHKLAIIEGVGHDLRRGRFDLNILVGGLVQGLQN